MMYLLNIPFDTVKELINFPARIAGNSSWTAVTVHNDQTRKVREAFRFGIVEARDEWDWDYQAPEWVLAAHGENNKWYGQFATFTDGEYCMSVRGELIRL